MLCDYCTAEVWTAAMGQRGSETWLSDSGSKGKMWINSKFNDYVMLLGLCCYYTLNVVKLKFLSNSFMIEEKIFVFFFFSFSNKIIDVSFSSYSLHSCLLQLLIILLLQNFFLSKFSTLISLINDKTCVTYCLIILLLYMLFRRFWFFFFFFAFLGAFCFAWRIHQSIHTCNIWLFT